MITVKGLQKKFKDFCGLKNAHMNVKKGQIYNFIGSKGSGKTTTMNILPGFLTLASAFGIHFISSLFNIHRWTPSGLLVEAQKLMPSINPSLLIPMAVTVLLIIVMTVLTLSRLRQLEWNVRATH